jgi:DnaJ-domain-containing protein 1
MGSSGDILVGSVEPPALNRRLADPHLSKASNSATLVFLGRAGRRDAHALRRAERPRTQAGRTPAHPGGRNARAPPGSRRRDARSVCPGYARLRRACQRGCASSAQAGSDARASSRLTQAQRPRPADTSRGQDARAPRRNARAPRQAECPRTQAGGMPAHPGGRDARAPRRAGCPRTQAAGDARAPPGSRRRDARSVCPGYARLRRACQRGCASSAQAGSDARASSRLTQARRPRPARFTQARCPQRLPWVRAPPARMPARMRLQCAGGQ